MLAGLVENCHARCQRDVELEVKPHKEQAKRACCDGHQATWSRRFQSTCGRECLDKLDGKDFIHATLIQKRLGETLWRSSQEEKKVARVVS